MSNNDNNDSSDGYIWIQGNIRGRRCLIYGVTSTIKDSLPHNFNLEEVTNGYRITAAPTAAINFIVKYGYRIKETTTIDHFNLLWTLQQQNLT